MCEGIHTSRISNVSSDAISKLKVQVQDTIPAPSVPSSEKLYTGSRTVKKIPVVDERSGQRNGGD